MRKRESREEKGGEYREGSGRRGKRTQTEERQKKKEKEMEEVVKERGGRQWRGERVGEERDRKVGSQGKKWRKVCSGESRRHSVIIGRGSRRGGTEPAARRKNIPGREVSIAFLLLSHRREREAFTGIALTLPLPLGGPGEAHPAHK